MYNDSVSRIAKKLEIKTGVFLITGATGLIGSCFIDVLVYANKNLDASFKIYALGRSEEKIKNRFGNEVIPVEQDISTPLSMNVKYDYIIHAASNASPRMYAEFPAETIITNVIGCKNVLDYCKKNMNTRLLFTSTFEIYGHIEDIDTYTEDMTGIIDLQILRNCYPESKRCSELLLKSYVDEYGIDAVIARLSSIYGPTMQIDDNKAHAQFIKKALNHENIVLKSEGTQKRTYCYVVDAVSALLTILFKGDSGKAYNVSNENSIATIAEVAKICADIAGTTIKYELPSENERKGYSKPQNCILDNTKLKELGWQGRYSVQDGMQETIMALRENHK